MNSYKIEFDRKVKRDLKSIDIRDIKRIKVAIQKLGNNPRPEGCKKLKGNRQDYYRIRVGNYRIIYIIKDDVLLVLVIRIGHRSEVYKNI